jgi:hypothetical protein
MIIGNQKKKGKGGLTNPRSKAYYYYYYQEKNFSYLHRRKMLK